MKLFEFADRFPDEKSCRIHFKEARIRRGVICKRCKGTDHYWLEGKEQFQCKKCKFRTTLRSGTVMECSNLPFRDWYICMHLMTATKKSISACEMQRQLGRKRYQPAWEMMHKVRLLMGHCSEAKAFSEFFQISKSLLVPGGDKSEENSRGERPHVLIAVDDRSERILLLDRTKKEENRSSGYNTISPYVCNLIRSTDAGYSGDRVPGWMHNIIHNSKKIIGGIHHFVSKVFLQSYLDEYCFKFNRRNDIADRFHSVVLAAAHRVWNC